MTKSPCALPRAKTRSVPKSPLVSKAVTAPKTPQLSAQSPSLNNASSGVAPCPPLLSNDKKKAPEAQTDVPTEVAALPKPSNSSVSSDKSSQLSAQSSSLNNGSSDVVMGSPPVKNTEATPIEAQTAAKTKIAALEPSNSSVSSDKSSQLSAQSSSLNNTSSGVQMDPSHVKDATEAPKQAQTVNTAEIAVPKTSISSVSSDKTSQPSTLNNTSSEAAQDTQMGVTSEQWSRLDSTTEFTHKTPPRKVQGLKSHSSGSRMLSQTPSTTSSIVSAKVPQFHTLPQLRESVESEDLQQSSQDQQQEYQIPLIQMPSSPLQMLPSSPLQVPPTPSSPQAALECSTAHTFQQQEPISPAPSLPMSTQQDERERADLMRQQQELPPLVFTPQQVSQQVEQRAPPERSTTQSYQLSHTTPTVSQGAAQGSSQMVTSSSNDAFLQQIIMEHKAVRIEGAKFLQNGATFLQNAQSGLERMMEMYMSQRAQQQVQQQSYASSAPSVPSVPLLQPAPSVPYASYAPSISQSLQSSQSPLPVLQPVSASINNNKRKSTNFEDSSRKANRVAMDHVVLNSLMPAEHLAQQNAHRAIQQASANPLQYPPDALLTAHIQQPAQQQLSDVEQDDEEEDLELNDPVDPEVQKVVPQNNAPRVKTPKVYPKLNVPCFASRRSFKAVEELLKGDVTKNVIQRFKAAFIKLLRSDGTVPRCRTFTTQQLEHLDLLARWLVEHLPTSGSESSNIVRQSVRRVSVAFLFHSGLVFHSSCTQCPSHSHPTFPEESNALYQFYDGNDFKTGKHVTSNPFKALCVSWLANHTNQSHAQINNDF